MDFPLFCIFNLDAKHPFDFLDDCKITKIMSFLMRGVFIIIDN